MTSGGGEKARTILSKGRHENVSKKKTNLMPKGKKRGNRKREKEARRCCWRRDEKKGFGKEGRGGLISSGRRKRDVEHSKGEGALGFRIQKRAREVDKKHPQFRDQGKKNREAQLERVGFTERRKSLQGGSLIFLGRREASTWGRCQVTQD